MGSPRGGKDSNRLDNRVTLADGAQHLDAVKALIIEYTDFLCRELTFQRLGRELDGLAARYIPPHGRILCAQAADGTIIGCAAYRRHSRDPCEMKRPYVKPEYRELHAGRRLMEELLRLAKGDGYRDMVLDTIRPLESAIHLYKKYGFTEITPYYDNPIDDVI